MTEVIDAHQHFWDLTRKEFDYSWLENPKLRKIHRTFLPGDLEPLLKSAGVHRSIFVQTQHRVQENRWALDLADKHPFIAGVVGWVDLRSRQVEAQLEEFLDHPRFVGIRHVVQDEPDENWVVHPETLRGLRVLEKHRVPFDLLFYEKHLRHAPEVARSLPDLPLVIDHLSKPKIREQIHEEWARELRAAAEFPNVFCKLSGLVTEADWDRWTPADLRPYVETALEAFGPNRCLFGSDWPVCELAAGYGQVIQALRQTLGALSLDEEAAIFGGNAARFYGLAADGAGRQ